MKGQIRALQPERLRIGHQVLLWGERQNLQIVDRAHIRRIDTMFRPAPAIIRMPLCAKCNLPRDEGILHLANFGKGLPQYVRHRRRAPSVSSTKVRNRSAAAGMS